MITKLVMSPNLDTSVRQNIESELENAISSRRSLGHPLPDHIEVHFNLTGTQGMGNVMPRALPNPIINLNVLTTMYDADNKNYYQFPDLIAAISRVEDFFFIASTLSGKDYKLNSNDFVNIFQTPSYIGVLLNEIFFEDRYQADIQMKKFFNRCGVNYHSFLYGLTSDISKASRIWSNAIVDFQKIISQVRLAWILSHEIDHLDALRSPIFQNAFGIGEDPDHMTKKQYIQRQKRDLTYQVEFDPMFEMRAIFMEFYEGNAWTDSFENILSTGIDRYVKGSYLRKIHSSALTSLVNEYRYKRELDLPTMNYLLHKHFTILGNPCQYRFFGEESKANPGKVKVIENKIDEIRTTCVKNLVRSSEAIYLAFHKGEYFDFAQFNNIK